MLDQRMKLWLLLDQSRGQVIFFYYFSKIKFNIFPLLAPDGQIFTLTYVADENGYRAIGDHLPKAPVVP